MPFLGCLLNHPLRLAVNTQCVGTCADMTEVKLGTCCAKSPGHIAGPIVGHDCMNLDALLPIPCHRGAEHLDRRCDSIVGKELDLGNARVIVDRHMQRFSANPAGRALPGTVPGYPMTS